MLVFNYFADVKRTIYDSEYKRLLLLMKESGVSVLWLMVKMAGKYWAEKSEIIRAKDSLENMGFEVNAIVVPVGHPGNALNPEEEIDLALPKDWNYRIDENGNKVYFCACIDDNVIENNREVVEFCRDIGIKKLFFDDDLRMGNHGNKIEGCYCEKCLNNFAKKVGHRYTVEEISKACKVNDALSKAWVEFNCSKITEFMVKTSVDGMQTGIMVMHNGDKRHGVDIAAIKSAVPNCLFRVGEFHFDDTSFVSDMDHKDEMASMKMHLSLINDLESSYSETTVFPPNALSPQNLIEKIEVALRLGIRNIFLMSGTWVMSDAYWHAISENRSRLERLSESVL